MGKKKNTAVLDALKTAKKKNREEEIFLHGKQISTRPTKIQKSKKVYDRKRDRKNPNLYKDGSDFFIFLKLKEKRLVFFQQIMKKNFLEKNYFS